MKLRAVRYAIHVLRQVEIAAADAAIALRTRYATEIAVEREVRIAAMWKRVGR